MAQDIEDRMGTGAPEQPIFNFFRPACLAITIQMEYYGIQDLQYPTQASSISWGLTQLTLGIGIGFIVASHYFRTQLPTPPLTKKSFWKTLYEKMANKLRPEPVLHPVAEPEKQYAAE